MAQKNATPNKAQIEILRRNGLGRCEWTVVKDLTNSLIVMNRFTGEFKVLDKIDKQ